MTFPEVRRRMILLIFILPLFGILSYVIARPTMTEQDRQMARSAAAAQGSSANQR